jgi:N-acylneuraminate cytidylyltransferase/CMP-N,N'-diacetyllegionaminic acid synthase
MFKNEKVLGIIPARSNSKRLKNKNIIDLAGKPLINYTIKAGLESQYIDELIVSTDSEKISRIAENAGATIPFLRPAALSEDNTSSTDVIEHAVDYLKKENGQEFDYIILLQPTSALRDAIEIDRSFKSMETIGCDALVSVTRMDHPPQWSNVLPPDLNMKNFLKDEIQNRRSQEFSNYYRLNGAIYIAKMEYFKRHKGFWGEDTHAFVMERNKSVDIDDAWDLKLAEFLIKNP